MLPYQPLREHLHRYGLRKPSSIQNPTVDGVDVHCGTNCDVLAPWFFGTNVAENEESSVLKSVWTRESNDSYKYEFVFHECRVPDDASIEALEQRIIGCSFHPKGVFKESV